MTSGPLRLAIAGCTGRMGRALLRLAAADPNWRIAAALTAPGDRELGRDAGAVAGIDELKVNVTESCASPLDVMIEFTSPDGCKAWAGWCGRHAVPLVSGTTGLEAAHRAALDAAAQSVPVLWAANMSVGVNLLLKLVEEAGRTLGAAWDCEIVETHHNRKADAPSGTAKALLDALRRGRGDADPSFVRHGREGVIGPRAAGEIGLHAVRMGGVVGDHDVHFATPGEIVTLRHHAESRDIFAAGALRAARWLVGRAPGRYQMRDVLAP
ncbi:MAG: 4-hydroxy-tetrahydrodipicolinate reductase [Planctomycetes bacterium]|nr:4-hydroxy-tetrahydrodipicolinate reductase [Planctomycetota bacterium]